MSQPAPDDALNVIPDFEVESIARCLLPVLKAFYDSPEGQQAFDHWKKEHTDDI